MTTYAVIEIGGRQYRVEEGEKILVNRLPQDKGKKISPKALLYRPEKGEPVFAGADLQKVKVDAVVTEHMRGEKVRIFKHRPKKGYKRHAGHRSELTQVEIKTIKMSAGKPKAAEKAIKAKEAKAPETKEKEEKKAKPKKPAKTKSEAKPAEDKKKQAEPPEDKKKQAEPTEEPKSEKKSPKSTEESKSEEKSTSEKKEE